MAGISSEKNFVTLDRINTYVSEITIQKVVVLQTKNPEIDEDVEGGGEITNRQLYFVCQEIGLTIMATSVDYYGSQINA